MRGIVAVQCLFGIADFWWCCCCCSCWCHVHWWENLLEHCFGLGSMYAPTKHALEWPSNNPNAGATRSIKQTLHWYSRFHSNSIVYCLEIMQSLQTKHAYSYTYNGWKIRLCSLPKQYSDQQNLLITLPSSFPLYPEISRPTTMKIQRVATKRKHHIRIQCHNPPQKYTFLFNLGMLIIASTSHSSIKYGMV